MSKNNKVEYIHLGSIDYQQAWDIQKNYFSQIVDTKVKNREAREPASTPNYLLFCEHPPVFTLGKTGVENHLLVQSTFLKEKGISFYHIDRGGDITYHGPGQIVGYPIFDLENFFTDIHQYLRYLEEAIIRTLSEYGIVAGRIPKLTGVWIDSENPLKARKIAALGVRASRWVTMHGFAFNINTDLSYFNYIIPCGIQDKAVTSLQKELGKEVSMHEVESKLLLHLSVLFNFHIISSHLVD